MVPRRRPDASRPSPRSDGSRITRGSIGSSPSGRCTRVYSGLVCYRIPDIDPSTSSSRPRVVNAEHPTNRDVRSPLHVGYRSEFERQRLESRDQTIKASRNASDDKLAWRSFLITRFCQDRHRSSSMGLFARVDTHQKYGSFRIVWLSSTKGIRLRVRHSSLTLKQDHDAWLITFG